jgi:hypothetical protein
MKVQIGTVNTMLDFNEPVGSLSPDEVRRLMQMLQDHQAEVQWKQSRHEEDRAIRNRSYMPDSERENT